MLTFIRLLLLLTSTLVASRAIGQDQPEPASEALAVEQLGGLADVWAAAKYFHPYLAYRPIDWDQALVTALPKVAAARTPQEYADAVQTMLDALHDPATRVMASSKREESAGEKLDRDRDPRVHRDRDGLLTVTVSHYGDLIDVPGAMKALGTIGADAAVRGIIFDLRSPVPTSEDVRGLLSYVVDDPSIAGQFIPAAITPLPERRRMHAGFASHGEGSSFYYSGAYLIDGARIEPAEKHLKVPVVFLVNQNSELPRVAFALQANGAAAIVADGRMPPDGGIFGTQNIELPSGVTCRLRLGEIVGAADGPGADVTVSETATSDGDQALEVARAFARGERQPSKVGVPAAPLSSLGRPDPEYAEMSFPSREYRLLAAFRIWAVFHYFSPHGDLIGEDWNQVLRDFIPRFQRAADESEYALAIAEMLTHRHDSHVSTRAPALVRYLGDAAPPLRVRMIEGVPIVTDVRGAKGIRVGDAILAVDGEAVNVRIARLSKYASASTPQALSDKVAARLLRGADGSTATLRVQSASGRAREVKLKRKADYLELGPERSADVVKLLPGNIGYADLDRLTVPEVDAMFERFKETKAIIFDMRGYPQMTAWAIAPRLSEKPAPVAAIFREPVPMAPITGDDRARTTTQFEQRIPRSEKWVYRNKTVMLIDERAASQAEHTGLFLRAANGTKFVGGHTNGANGDVSSFVLPGGIRVWFTGMDVRHPDGTQLQRVGLVPDVEVRPTIAGIRQGRDEVLERAIELVNSGS